MRAVAMVAALLTASPAFAEDPAVGICILFQKLRMPVKASMRVDRAEIIGNSVQIVATATRVADGKIVVEDASVTCPFRLDRGGKFRLQGFGVKHCDSAEITAQAELDEASGDRRNASFLEARKAADECHSSVQRMKDAIVDLEFAAVPRGTYPIAPADTALGR